MTEHLITTRRSLIRHLVLCSCGWQFSTPRRQNALARAARIRTAIAAHLKTGDTNART